MAKVEDLNKRDKCLEDYQASLQDAIKQSLNDPNLDKYDTCQKILIKLLNIVSVLTAPIKYVATGTFFYSTEGKSKEAVRDALDISESMLPKKP